MKKIKYFAFILILFIVSIFNVKADSSDFIPVLNMETDITENQVQLILGFSGEEIMIVNHTLSYDNTKLKLADVVAYDNFNVEVTDESKDGKWSTVKILADSDYSFNDSNYAVVYFDVLSGYKTGRSADIFVYYLNSVGPDKQKYRHTGQLLKVKRESSNEISYSVTDISKNTKIEYWFRANYLFFVLGGVVIIGVIILLMVLPSKRKKEARDQDVGNNIKGENYDPNSNFKIDQNEIDSIGRVEKPIDMSQAIIVNDNVKPFGEIIGKFDEPTQDVANQSQPVQQVSVFNATTPEAMSATIDPFNMSTQEQNPEAASVTLEDDGIKEIDESNGLIQIASTTLEAATPEDVSSVPTFDVVTPNQTSGLAPVENPVSAVLEAPTTSTSLETLAQEQAPVNVSAEQLAQTIQDSQVVQNVVDTSDMLVVKGDINALPSAPAPVAAPDVMNVLPSDDSSEGGPQVNNNGSGFMNVLILLLAVASLFSISNVKAEEYNVKKLRDCLIGKVECVESLDYNKDGSYDILDLLATKDTTDCNFEKKMKSDPGFKELHGQSNNIMSKEQKTTTKKAGIVTKKTTTKKGTTAKGTTAKRSTTAKGTTTKKSTTARSTTSRTTTTRKSTTARSTTSRSTTSKKTTTKKSTTTKTTAPTYTITINVSNASTSTRTVPLRSDKSTLVYFTPNAGYKFGSVSCDGVSGSFSGTANRLTLSKPTKDGSCTVNYTLRNDMKVSITANYMYSNNTKTSKSFSLTGTYNTEKSISVDGTGYTYKGMECSNYVSQNWSNNYFSARLSNDSSCTINFAAKTYSLGIYIDGALQYSPNVEYGVKKTHTVSIKNYPRKYKLTCNGKSVTFTTVSLGENYFEYSFTYTPVDGTNKCDLS